MNEQFGAVVVAAGQSSRMGGSGSKVLLELGGQPVLRYSLKALDSCPQVGEICIVCREEDKEAMLSCAAGLSTPVTAVPGGAQRQESVWLGVQALGPDWGYLLIHDGARPLVTEKLIQAVCRDALTYGAATAAVPSKDTCKLSDKDGFVRETPPREQLSAIQTPQAFEREMYLYAARRAMKEGKACTDDCQLIEWAGGKVKLTPGDYKNIKLTTPEDMAAARAFLGLGAPGKERLRMRIGYGYDVHKLAPGRALVLGGVRIPYEKGLLGHSDADVITHAVMDALLGAAALGDIGQLFPDNDPRYEGADSLSLLGEVVRLLGGKGFSIENIDVTLTAQRPKVSPYVPQMRGRLGEACGLPLERVSVKATTEEGLGFTGEGAGMAASAVCLLTEG